ncbi:MAG: calcium/sodium antiporter [Gemmatimonadales bacterium]|nr:MAG: calcium/sodium antiporter [Gemmatimonadales bacterium]
MLADLAILLGALAVLVKSADWLVENAVHLARRVHTSDLLIGLLITSVGTSLPELTSSLAAALAGSPALVIGNVSGSNIANIGLVIGVAALVRPFATAPKMHDRDGFIMIAAAVLFFALVQDNRLGRLEAAAFLFLYTAYVAFVARTDRGEVEQRFADFLKFTFGLEYARPVVRGLRKRRPRTGSPARASVHRAGLGREATSLVVSTAALVVSARYVVVGAVGLAGRLDVPENLIGLSLVAVGTSLPELLVAVAAARRGNAELIVGNVIGSNIANVLLILGLTGLVRPLEVPELSVVYSIPISLFFSLALLHFIRTDWRISRVQGALVVVAYLAFLGTAFVLGWG